MRSGRGRGLYSVCDFCEDVSSAFDSESWDAAMIGLGGGVSGTGTRYFRRAARRIDSTWPDCRNLRGGT